MNNIEQEKLERQNRMLTAWKKNPYFPYYKPIYKNRPTKTMRVPEKLIEKVQRYAFAIDQEKLVEDTTDRLIDILAKLTVGETGYKSNSASQLIKDLKALIP